MDTQRTSFLDLLTVVLKHRWSAGLIVLSATLGVLFWMFFIREDTYDASAKLLVRIGHEQSTSNILSKSPVVITGDRSQDVNSESLILQSTDLLNALISDLALDQPLPPKPVPDKLLPRIRYEVKQVVHEVKDRKDTIMISLGLKESLSPREKALATLREALVVVPERNSNIITVHLYVQQREYAAPILNKLLDLYEAFRIKVYQEPGTSGFFRGEAKQAAGSLMGAEEQLRSFEDKWHISALQKQKEVLLEQIAANQAEVNNGTIEVRDLGSKLSRAEKEANAEDPDIAGIGSFSNDTFPQSLMQQLATLEAERQKLRMTELETGPRIKNNREQFRGVLHMVNDYLKARLADRQASLNRRTEMLGSLRAEVRGLQDKEGQWSSLKRNVKMGEDSYLDYQKRFEESSATSVMEQQNIGNVSIVQHASTPMEAIGMPKFRVLGLAFLIALIAAAAWIGISELLDDRIYTASDLQSKTGFSVLEVVPLIGWRPWKTTAAPLAAYYRKTSWALASSVKPGEPASTVFFTGTRPGAGVTSTVLTLAKHLRSFHKLRVLVMELDSQHPSLLSRLDLHADKTLDSYLSGDTPASEVIYKSSSGFSVAPLSAFSEERSWSLARLQSFIDELRPSFELILIDGPPITSPDGLMLFPLAKSVVLVAESGRTRLVALESLTRELGFAHIPVFGAVLNRHRDFVPGWMHKWLAA